MENIMVAIAWPDVAANGNGTVSPESIGFLRNMCLNGRDVIIQYESLKDEMTNVGIGQKFMIFLKS